jgi:O-antigen/teichoic acid export membrane protein
MKMPLSVDRYLPSREPKLPEPKIDDPRQQMNVPARQKSLGPLSTEHLHMDLKGRSVRGGLLTLTSQGTQFVTTSIATVVLARLLTPADFGLVAMVTSLTGLAQGFADLGLSEATIQRQEINHDQVSSLFWINFAIGLALTLVTASLAPVLALLYREPRLKDITLVVSLTFLICGLRVQHDALLRRQMRFVSMAIRDVSSYALAVPVAIVMAWKGAGYWALVALPLTVNLTQVVFSWLMVGWIPGAPRRDAKVRSLIVFGGNVATSYLLYNSNRSADSILIGWHWGAGSLGLYARAYNLLMLPVRQLSTPARSVIVPALSRIQGDPERFARYYLGAVNLIMWISAPIFGFLFVAAEPVIVLVLGMKWREASPVFQILVLAALGQLLLDSTLWVFVSRGESQRLLKLLLIISPIIIGGFLIGLPFGIKGVALSGSLVLVAILPWILRFTFRGTSLTLQRLLRSIVCPISLSLAGILFAELALHSIAPPHTASQLLVVALSFVAVYSLSALLPPVRKETIFFRRLFDELALFRQNTRLKV